ncbi:hypothetical protein FJZ36_06790 [Candidatus Poribacteria bacterium]|nr:hypothetical protein [Candidatus Poribacteria bacterium]
MRSVIALLAAFIVTSALRADTLPKVLFSFGRNEVLREGSNRWTFIRAGDSLESADLVRMPPMALLRIADANGRGLPLLTGARESSAKDLVSEAAAQVGRTQGRRIGAAASEPGSVDALPAGDPVRGDSDDDERPMSRAEAGRWLRFTPSPSALSQRLALEASERADDSLTSDSMYPSSVFAKTRATFEAVRGATENSSGVGESFDDAYLLVSVLQRLGLRITRDIDARQRPVVVIDLGVVSRSASQLTANQALYRIGDEDRLLLPLCATPASRTFLEAWYAEEQVTGRPVPAP